MNHTKSHIIHKDRIDSSKNENSGYPNSKKLQNTTNKNKQKIDTNTKLKSFLPKLNRKRRQYLLVKNNHLQKIYYSTSKHKFIKILMELPQKYKMFLKKYLRDWFIFHIHMRPIENIRKVLAKRTVLYDAIDDPRILKSKKGFPNNLIKNFSRGVVNFIVIYENELAANKIFIMNSPKNFIIGDKKQA